MKRTRFNSNSLLVNIVSYNMLGVASAPHAGVNMVVTTYDDGSKSTVKQIVK
jgi:hypothetical protein